jgi:hypothetical protein
MRLLSTILIWVILAASAAATTLQKLSMDEMTAQATSIVRARVVDSWGAKSGSVIYTHYKIQVSERLKGAGDTSIEILIPGGIAAGLQQTIPGAPKLMTGNEYVLFLWKGPSGANHVMGLSQGVFDLKTSPSGVLTLYRGPLDARVLDSRGQAADASRLEMSWSDFTAQMKKSVGAAR